MRPKELIKDAVREVLDERERQRMAKMSANGVAIAWDALGIALKASSVATKEVWNAWHDAQEALMRELRRDPQVMKAWRDWLQVEARAYDLEGEEESK